MQCKDKSTSEEAAKKLKSDDEVKPFYLPDGTAISIGSERTKATEILFQPSILGFEHPGLHQLVINSIKRADMDLRENLYKNIYLSGGNTLIDGFKERINKEMSACFKSSGTTVYLY